MEMFNEYGIISGGYLFDYLDKKCHSIARKSLEGDCLTVSANIQFFSKLDNMDNISIETQILGQTRKTITLLISLKIADKIAVVGNFTFAKV